LRFGRYLKLASGRSDQGRKQFSFEKKRSPANQLPGDKSFLLLFFKKEGLAYAARPRLPPAAFHRS